MLFVHIDSKAIARKQDAGRVAAKRVPNRSRRVAGSIQGAETSATECNLSVMSPVNLTRTPRLEGMLSKPDAIGLMEKLGEICRLNRARCRKKRFARTSAKTRPLQQAHHQGIRRERWCNSRRSLALLALGLSLAACVGKSLSALQLKTCVSSSSTFETYGTNGDGRWQGPGRVGEVHLQGQSISSLRFSAIETIETEQRTCCEPFTRMKDLSHAALLKQITTHKSIKPSIHPCMHTYMHISMREGLESMILYVDAPLTRACNNRCGSPGRAVWQSLPLCPSIPAGKLGPTVFSPSGQ